jgi:hypothetical protein
MMRRLNVIAAAAALLVSLAAGPAAAAKPTVALFPPANLSGEDVAPFVPLLASIIAEKLADRFDVRPVKAVGANDSGSLRNRARPLGALYTVTGQISRIGTTVTLDLTIAPVEEPGKGRTVIATASDAGGRTDGSLPPAYRRLVIEAAAKLKYVFFGDEVVGEETGRRKIPRPSGTISRSNAVPGNVLSAALGDLDGDGKVGLVAAYPDGIAIYAIEGDDLRETGRIPGWGGGHVRIFAADLTRNGLAEVVAVRYAGGSARSDIWERDGAGFRRLAGDVPLFLRPLRMGDEGVVLLGQESDPETVYKGPVFLLSLDRHVEGALEVKEGTLPLPPGTGIYDFVSLRDGPVGGQRFARINGQDRLDLLDGGGGKIGESMDFLYRTESVLEDRSAARGMEGGGGDGRRALPGRLIAVDLDGDGTDELVTVGNLAAAGRFFEGVRFFVDSEVLAFAQDGSSIRLAWRTNPTGVPARDWLVDPSPDGGISRVGIVTYEKVKILSGPIEWRILWIR